MESLSKCQTPIVGASPSSAPSLSRETEVGREAAAWATLDRAPVDSTTSSGKLVATCCCLGSPPLDFLAVLLLFGLLWPKSLGMKHVG